MSNSTFMDLLMEGYVLSDEIDDFVEKWHSDKPDIPLSEFLGMSKDEYNAWVLDESVLGDIAHARETSTPLPELLRLRASGDYRLAARSRADSFTQAVVRWLADNAPDNAPQP